MTTRDRSREFILLRSGYDRQLGKINNENNEDNVNNHQKFIDELKNVNIELDKLIIELDKENQNRLLVRFDDDIIQNQMSNTNANITELFKKANLLIDNYQVTDASIKNMLLFEKRKLYEKYLKMRKDQREFITKLEKIKSGKSHFFDDEEDEEDEKYDIEKQTITSINKSDLKKRDVEIKKLTENIETLAGLFKNLSIFTLQQGEILDRIDENIENTAFSIKKGNENIKKVSSNKRSNCTDKLIICLLIIIFIEIVIFVIKKS
jgi:hypothetical protein